ncbi:hypothetical protein HK102_008515 [Quaeritorhiza haematococci]|nr:hypothetical protein HK102_008515 [Quaeritorhiza haematococci]
MPKRSPNSKAVAAAEKKSAVKAERDALKQKQKEELEAKEWAVGAKDTKRKELEEQKRKEALAKKAEREALLAAEEKEIAKAKPILKGAEKQAQKRTLKIESIARELGSHVEEFSASNIDDALDLLTLATEGTGAKSTDNIERHPERRMKSAYAAFEEREMPILKAENPGLRLSQLKQLLQKMWKKSPENPMNQQHISFDTKRDQEAEIIEQQRTQALEAPNPTPNTPSICIVARHFGPLNAEKDLSADAAARLAETLVSSPLSSATGAVTKVTVLYVGPENPQCGHVAEEYRKKGIDLISLPRSGLPFADRPIEHLSFEIYRFFRTHHQSFSIVHFILGSDPSLSTAAPYYTLRARSQGLLCTDTKFVIGLDHLPHADVEGIVNGVPGGVGFFLGDGGAGLDEEHLVTDLGTLKMDYVYRKNMEMADYLVAPSRQILDAIMNRGLQFDSSRTFIAPPIPSSHSFLSREKLHHRPLSFQSSSSTNLDIPSSASDRSKPTELVFVGNLDPKDGIGVFCDALDHLSEHLAAHGVRVTFLGPSRVFGAIGSEEYVELRSSNWDARMGWDVVVVDDVRSMVGYFDDNNRQGEVSGREVGRRSGEKVAVFPAMFDGSAFVAHEMLVRGVPMLASSANAIGEFLDEEDKKDVVFAPNGVALAEKIMKVITESAPIPKSLTDCNAVAYTWSQLFTDVDADVSPYASCISPSETLPNIDGPDHSNDPLVSVVLVHHNRVKLLEQAIESIEQQTYTNLEVVLVDDGSTDPEALDFITELSWKWWETKGWKVLREPNRYLGAARNTGVKYAIGKYVVFMDDDDYAKPHQLRTLVDVAQKTGAMVVTSGHDVFFDGTKPPGDSSLSSRYLPLGDASLPGMLENVYGDSKFLVDRSFFTAMGGFTEDFGVGFEDYEFLARVVLKGHHLEAVPEALNWYRRHQHTMSSTTNLKANQMRMLRAYVEAHATASPGQRRLLMYTRELFFDKFGVLPFESERNNTMVSTATRAPPTTVTITTTGRFDVSTPVEYASTTWEMPSSTFETGAPIDTFTLPYSTESIINPFTTTISQSSLSTFQTETGASSTFFVPEGPSSSLWTYESTPGSGSESTTFGFPTATPTLTTSFPEPTNTNPFQTEPTSTPSIILPESTYTNPFPEITTGNTNTKVVIATVSSATFDQSETFPYFGSTSYSFPTTSSSWPGSEWTSMDMFPTGTTPTPFIPPESWASSETSFMVPTFPTLPTFPTWMASSTMDEGSATTPGLFSTDPQTAFTGVVTVSSQTEWSYFSSVGASSYYHGPTETLPDLTVTDTSSATPTGSVVRSTGSSDGAGPTQSDVNGPTQTATTTSSSTSQDVTPTTATTAKTTTTGTQSTVTPTDPTQSTTSTTTSPPTSSRTTTISGLFTVPSSTQSSRTPTPTTTPVDCAQSLKDCRGKCPGDEGYPYTIDCTSSCVPLSLAAEYDDCNVCGGNGTSCLVSCPGGEVPDLCGVCGGNGTSCFTIELEPSVVPNVGELNVTIVGAGFEYVTDPDSGQVADTIYVDGKKLDEGRVYFFGSQYFVITIPKIEMPAGKLFKEVEVRVEKPDQAPQIRFLSVFDTTSRVTDIVNGKVYVDDPAQVTVLGQNLLRFPRMACVVDATDNGLQTKAVYLSPTSILCQIPPLNISGPYEVYILYSRPLYATPEFPSKFYYLRMKYFVPSLSTRFTDGLVRVNAYEYAPMLVEAQFSDTGASITMEFDKAVVVTDGKAFAEPSGNSALPVWPPFLDMEDPVVCSQLLQTNSTSGGLLARDSDPDDCTVVRISPRSFQLSIKGIFAAQYRAILPGERIVLRENTVWTAGVVFSDPATHSIPVEGPDNIPMPNIIANAPTFVGDCPQLMIDLSTTSGSAGRPWLHVEFTFTADQPNINDTLLAFTLQDLADSFKAGGLSVFAIPSEAIAPRTYTFNFTVVNFLGGAASDVITVKKVATNDVPYVVMSVDPGRKNIPVKSAITLSATIIPFCVDEPVTFNWSLASGTTSIELDEEDATESAIVLDPYTTAPLGTYVFNVGIGFVNRTVYPFTITITTAIDNVFASAGASRRIGTLNRLLLDANIMSDGYPPDNLDTSIFECRWNCSIVGTGQPCMTNSQTELSIPRQCFGVDLTNQLPGGNRYRMSLTAVNTRTRAVGLGSPSVITLVNGFLPIVYIAPQDLKPSAYSRKFFLEAKWDPTTVQSTAGELTFVWSSLSNCDEKDYMSLPLDQTTLATASANAPVLKFLPGRLTPAATYCFRVRLNDPKNPEYGEASMLIPVRNRPMAGYCTSAGSPLGVAFRTEFIVACYNWVTDPLSYPLFYTYRIARDDGTNITQQLQIDSKWVLFGPLNTSSVFSTALPPGKYLLRAVITDSAESQSAEEQVISVEALETLPQASKRSRQARRQFATTMNNNSENSLLLAQEYLQNGRATYNSSRDGRASLRRLAVVGQALSPPVTTALQQNLQRGIVAFLDAIITDKTVYLDASNWGPFATTIFVQGLADSIAFDSPTTSQILKILNQVVGTISNNSLATQTCVGDNIAQQQVNVLNSVLGSIKTSGGAYSKYVGDTLGSLLKTMDTCLYRVRACGERPLDLVTKHIEHSLGIVNVALGASTTQLCGFGLPNLNQNLANNSNACVYYACGRRSIQGLYPSVSPFNAISPLGYNVDLRDSVGNRLRTTYKNQSIEFAIQLPAEFAKTYGLANTTAVAKSNAILSGDDDEGSTAVVAAKGARRRDLLLPRQQMDKYQALCAYFVSSNPTGATSSGSFSTNGCTLVSVSANGTTFQCACTDAGNFVIAVQFQPGVPTTSPTATATPTRGPTPGGPGANTGAIAGGVVAGAVVLTLVAGGFVWLRRKRTMQKGKIAPNARSNWQSPVAPVLLTPTSAGGPPIRRDPALLPKLYVRPPSYADHMRMKMEQLEKQKQDAEAAAAGPISSSRAATASSSVKRRADYVAGLDMDQTALPGQIDFEGYPPLMSSSVGGLNGEQDPTRRFVNMDTEELFKTVEDEHLMQYPPPPLARDISLGGGMGRNVTEVEHLNRELDMLLQETDPSSVIDTPRRTPGTAGSTRMGMLDDDLYIQSNPYEPTYEDNAFGELDPMTEEGKDMNNTYIHVGGDYDQMGEIQPDDPSMFAVDDQYESPDAGDFNAVEGSNMDFDQMGDQVQGMDDSTGYIAEGEDIPVPADYTDEEQAGSTQPEDGFIGYDGVQQFEGQEEFAQEGDDGMRDEYGNMQFESQEPAEQM